MERRRLTVEKQRRRVEGGAGGGGGGEKKRKGRGLIRISQRFLSTPFINYAVQLSYCYVIYRYINTCVFFTSSHIIIIQ